MGILPCSLVPRPFPPPVFHGSEATPLDITVEMHKASLPGPKRRERRFINVVSEPDLGCGSLVPRLLSMLK